jgi:hypothetical protein
MCPVCWATALASFAGLFAVSIVAIVGTDRYILPVAFLLIVLTMLHSSVLVVPWWSFALPMGFIASRLATVMIHAPDKLLVHKLWKRAQRVAKQSCPRSDNL